MSAKDTAKNSSQVAERKKCFIVTPIGANGSETRRKTDGLIKSVLRPVLNDHGYDCKAAHEESASGSINRKILKSLLQNDLVIANLTELNPNVMYELAVRHARKRPVIQIAEVGTKLPFDIQDQRTIFYVNDMTGVEDLKAGLHEAIQAITVDDSIDNPITEALQEAGIDFQLESDQSDSPGNINKYIIDELKSLGDAVNKLSSDKTQQQKNFQSYGADIGFLVVAGTENNFLKFESLLLKNINGIKSISVTKTGKKFTIGLLLRDEIQLDLDRINELADKSNVVVDDYY